MIKEFKAFVTRGNVVDMAVGVIIGSAFGKIVSSFVVDVLMPPIGVLLGKVDFSNLFVTLHGSAFPSVAEAKKAGAVTLNYGLFFNTIMDFLITAGSMFFFLIVFQKLKLHDAEKATKDCTFCCTAIPRKAKRCPHCTSTL